MYEGLPPRPEHPAHFPQSDTEPSAQAKRNGFEPVRLHEPLESPDSVCRNEKNDASDDKANDRGRLHEFSDVYTKKSSSECEWDEDEGKLSKSSDCLGF